MRLTHSAVNRANATLATQWPEITGAIRLPTQESALDGLSDVDTDQEFLIALALHSCQIEAALAKSPAAKQQVTYLLDRVEELLNRLG